MAGSRDCMILLLVVGLVQTVFSLECYTCINQDSNKDKCIKTTKQCEEHHNTCQTRIEWKLPPYWTPYGDRVYYIWKDCATSSSCNALKAELMPHCKRDWYDDWACVECCAGDNCNYYVTLGSSGLQASLVVTCMSAVAGLLVLRNILQ